MWCSDARACIGCGPRRPWMPPAMWPTTESGSLKTIQLVHPVAVATRDLLGERGEVLDDAAPGPAALLLERERQVPVVHRHPRFEPALQAAVDQAVVVGATGVVPRAATVTHHAGPADREAVGVDTHRGDQVQVLVQSVERVDPVEPDRPAAHPTTAHGLVPHRRGLAVDVPRALDLERGRRHPPGERSSPKSARVSAIGPPRSTLGRSPARSAPSSPTDPGVPHAGTHRRSPMRPVPPGPNGVTGGPGGPRDPR